MDRCLLSQEQTRERGENQISGLLSLPLNSGPPRSDPPRHFGKKEGPPRHSCGKMELGFEARLPTRLPFFPVLLSLSPEFFQPNSSAALLNLRALEVAWASKRDGGCPRGLTVRLGSLQKIAGKVARALFSDIALCLESQYQKNASSQIKLYRRRRLFKPSACRDFFLVRHRLKKRSFRENSRNPRVLCRRRFGTLLRSRSARGPLSNKRSY